MEVECNNCKKEFHIRPSFYNKNKTKTFYCCKQCMLDYKAVKKVKVKCDTCNKDITKRITEVGETNFCNMECLRGYKKIKTLICEYCNKIFSMDESRYNSQVKRGQQPKFCSNECRHKGREKPKKRTAIKTKCLNCNKQFYIKRNNVSKDGNCCSLKCRREYNSNNKRGIVYCKNCKQELIRDISEINRYNTFFCNNDCKHEYAHIVKNTYSKVAHYLRTSNPYSIWRVNVFKRDFYKCVKCSSKDDIHAHHIMSLYDICNKYDMNIEIIINSTEFNDITNGITLCKDCHALEHPFVSRDEKGRFCRPHSRPQESEDN